jgi:carboxymethylenebutenolidase
MPSTDLTVTTPDGACAASLHIPTGDGPWPAVIMFPDAGGFRPTFAEMGERLAQLGYVVLVPDIYYRSGGYEPFSMDTVFTDPDERRRLGELAAALPTPKYLVDAAAFADFLSGRDEVLDGPIGTTGYCMGGRISLNVAGHLGERIGAAASFHGGGLAFEEDPDSPHLAADGVRATVYVGAAEDDRSFGPDQAERLAQAYDAAGVTSSIETYTAAHGFAVPDNPTFDEAASERHWSAMQQLFGDTLGA